jgi:hypothetical protein
MARNYVSAFGMETALHGDDGALPVDFTLHSWGGTKDEAKLQMDAYVSLVEGGFGPAYVWTRTDSMPINVFVCIDKTSIVRILQGNPDGIWYSSVPPVTQPNQWVRMVFKTPRYSGWSDQVGEKHAAAPSDAKGAKADFSGASDLFAAASGLLAYSDALRKAGEIRQAGIVKFAYDQIFSLKWTVTEAFDYLRENNLV